MAYFLKSPNSINCFELSSPEFFSLLFMFNDVKDVNLVSTDVDWTLVVPIKIVKSFLIFNNTVDDFSVNTLPLHCLS